MHPEIHALPGDTSAGTGRYLHRVHEVALQSIIEGTSAQPIRRALRSKSMPSGEALDFKLSEVADFYDSSGSKDQFSGHGPTEVIEKLPDRGQVKTRWSGQEMRRRLAKSSFLLISMR